MVARRGMKSLSLWIESTLDSLREETGTTGLVSSREEAPEGKFGQR
jgi:hypothetical protein